MKIYTEIDLDFDSMQSVLIDQRLRIIEVSFRNNTTKLRVPLSEDCLRELSEVLTRHAGLLETVAGLR